MKLKLDRLIAVAANRQSLWLCTSLRWLFVHEPRLCSPKRLTLPVYLLNYLSILKLAVLSGSSACRYFSPIEVLCWYTLVLYCKISLWHHIENGTTNTTVQRVVVDCGNEFVFVIDWKEKYCCHWRCCCNSANCLLFLVTSNCQPAGRAVVSLNQLHHLSLYIFRLMSIVLFSLCEHTCSKSHVSSICLFESRFLRVFCSFLFLLFVFLSFSLLKSVKF